MANLETLRIDVSRGLQGETGEGVPVGGTTGQRLAKASGDGYDTEWVDNEDWIKLVDDSKPSSAAPSSYAAGKVYIMAVTSSIGYPSSGGKVTTDTRIHDEISFSFQTFHDSAGPDGAVYERFEVVPSAWSVWEKIIKQNELDLKQNILAEGAFVDGDKTALDNSVAYADQSAQSRSDVEKAQARENIGVEDYFGPSANLFDAYTSTDNTAMGSDGVESFNSNYNLSDYIDVMEGGKYVSIDRMRFIAAFDSFDVVIPSAGLDSTVYEYIVPVGVSKIRVTVPRPERFEQQIELGEHSTSFTPYGSNLLESDSYVPEAQITKPLTDTWRSKKMCMLGDSVTAGGYVSSPIVNNYNLTLQNEGEGGTKVSGASADAMWQDARVDACDADSDLVLMMGGINDWANNVVLGLVTSADTNEFSGALNVMIGKLMARFPIKHIILSSPTHAQYNDFGSRPGTWTDAHTNDNGETLVDFAAAMEAVCKQWSIPFVDTHAEAGINKSNVASYSADLIHPNEAGGKRDAEPIIGKMNSLTPLD